MQRLKGHEQSQFYASRKAYSSHLSSTGCCSKKIKGKSHKATNWAGIKLTFNWIIIFLVKLFLLSVVIVETCGAEIIKINNGRKLGIHKIDILVIKGN